MPPPPCQELLLLFPFPYAISKGWLSVGTNASGFNLAGVPNQRVLVEASANLQNWQPLKTSTSNSSLLYFSDPEKGPARFYRARLVP